MKRSIIAVIAALGIMIACAGCTGNPESVEDEVTQALTDNNDRPEPEPIPDPEPEPNPEPALEHVDVIDPDESLMTESTLDADMVEMVTSEADDQGNEETAAEKTEPDTLQIVFLGDSIFDAVRDETGIAHIVGESLEADIYNLSIGGTSAALRKDKSTSKDSWTEPSLMGVLYTMQGELKSDVMDGYKAGEVIKELNPKKTDYFIIEYGTNDFLSYIPIGAEDVQQQYYFYFSTTLEMAIDLLKANYPNAQIILCTPYYEQFWSADRTRYIGDVHTVNNGFGTLLDYIGAIEGVARSKEVECLNMYDLMEIDTYSVDKMTVDGIHPNEEARRKYADILIGRLEELEEQKKAGGNSDE